MKKKNIILIGFMGSGKTVVGKKLAEDLNMKYLDTDVIIESKIGKSIDRIFKENGEESFRDIETQVISELISSIGSVVSTGGGIILREGNVNILKKLGEMFFLHATPTEIYNRIKDDKTRPLLNVPDPKARIEEILNFRDEKYSMNGIKVETSDKTVDDVCSEIENILSEGK